MAYRVEFREKVRNGLRDGFLWYEEKQAGLGSRFVAEVEAKIEYIIHHPFHFQIKYKDYREALLDKFPYLIIFQVKDDLLIFSSIFPCKKDPGQKIL